MELQCAKYEGHQGEQKEFLLSRSLEEILSILCIFWAIVLMKSCFKRNKKQKWIACMNVL